MTRPSDNQLASLIVRQNLAMTKESIGPDGEQPFDVAVDEWAVATVQADPGRTVTDHEMHYQGLLSDEQHDPCGLCAWRVGHTITFQRIPPGGQADAYTAWCSCIWVATEWHTWDEIVAQADRHIADVLTTVRSST